ncbi:hypothetical protein [Pedobacter namyangjuensis]|uniref:hypothetical protein n=1 Tax=Pedobacter namyangjuensis TaxID=600626 RepID=UPI0013B36066|nr:hypothetical protein [Pedobacter namyangjuensis]
MQSKYLSSKVLVDKIDEYHKADKLVGFKSYEKQMPEKREQKHQTGFCIRYGIEIPFYMDKPYSEKAYNSWAKRGQ